MFIRILPTLDELNLDLKLVAIELQERGKTHALTYAIAQKRDSLV
jgi:hypothetical protein